MPLSAHVLVTEETDHFGAILHLSNGDEPIAGETTGIYFEVKSPVNLQTAKSELVITSQDGGIMESVLLRAEGKTLSGAFIFPIRGTYTLNLTITQSNTTDTAALSFAYPVRVTRSVEKAEPSPHVPLWAQLGVVVCVWAVLALVILAYKRRHLISERSK